MTVMKIRKTVIVYKRTKQIKPEQHNPHPKKTRMIPGASEIQKQSQLRILCNTTRLCNLNLGYEYSVLD